MYSGLKHFFQEISFLWVCTTLSPLLQQTLESSGPRDIIWETNKAHHLREGTDWSALWHSLVCLPTCPVNWKNVNYFGIVFICKAFSQDTVHTQPHKTCHLLTLPLVMYLPGYWHIVPKNTLNHMFSTNHLPIHLTSSSFIACLTFNNINVAATDICLVHSYT